MDHSLELTSAKLDFSGEIFGWNFWKDFAVWRRRTNVSRPGGVDGVGEETRKKSAERRRARKSRQKRGGDSERAGDERGGGQTDSFQLGFLQINFDLIISKSFDELELLSYLFDM